MLDNALAEGQLSMEEHRERIRTATNASSLGQLQGLVSDLQTSSAPIQLQKLKRRPAVAGSGWGFRVATAAVLVGLGIGIGWGLYGNTSSPFSFTSDPGAKPDGIAPVVLTPPRQLQSLGGLTGLLEQMRQKFGDTLGYRLLVYPDYASVYRPDPTEDRRELDYDYRGGWDDPRTQPKSQDRVLVDLAKFDIKAVVGVLRGAPETLGIKPGDVKNTYLVIDPADDPLAPGSLELSIYVSSDYGSGNIQLTGDGTVKRISYPS